MTLGLVGLGSVATFTVGGFKLDYNPDHFNFGTGYTTLNTTSGLVTSGTIAIDAAAFVDVLTGFDATIDTAAATFALCPH